MDERLIAFKRLLDIMDDLRAKCPWDQKQTLESLRNLTIEETYELADAITSNDLEELKGEIGDLMLHMVFYCKIAEEKKAFDISEALNSVCDKLIHRHPHIYGDIEVQDEEEPDEVIDEDEQPVDPVTPSKVESKPTPGSASSSTPTPVVSEKRQSSLFEFVKK